jgi:DNA-binding protein HU-beta
MTKADIVSKISDKSGIEKADVLATVEAFMTEVKSALESGENVYLRGFGSFIIPAFKPAKTFAEEVKKNVLVK